MAKSKDTLNVWIEDELVGKLYRNRFGAIGFVYEGSWIEKGYPISQQMPFANSDYSPETGVAHQFFANLLPESNARQHIVRDLKITNSDYDLLKAIGGECAGTLSILQESEEKEKNYHYTQLTDEKLNQIILRRGRISTMLHTKNPPRLSLAGAQDKCPVFFDGNNYFLPQDSAPSTHILKFEIESYRHIPAYEYFLSQLAQAIELPVSKTELCQFENHYYLRIERYDRKKLSDRKIKRIHQEDFCQALGVSYERKYQEDGGPRFEDCFRLLQEVSTQPVIDSERLLIWHMFNLLAGNSDAHAKNLSLIYRDKHKIELAPFYDMVCTRAIEGIDIKLAMSVGDQFNPNMIKQIDWHELSKRCRVREQYVEKLFLNTAEKLLDIFTRVLSSVQDTIGEYPALQRVKKVVTKQCHRLRF